MMSLDPYIILLLLVIYIILITSTLFTIISEKRDPVKTVSWIVVVVTVPIFGFLSYVLFGQNYRKRKIFRRKIATDTRYISDVIKRQLHKVNSPLYVKRKEVECNRDIITLLLNNSSSLMTHNNNVSILNDGEVAFAEIIKSLKQAERFIHLEYYMFKSDDIGCEIIDILCEKARSGVEVRLIYDDVGSWTLSKRAINKLVGASVEVSSFMPVIFPFLTSKINYRNHRKILIIDGQVGFTGGMNIADKYIHGTSKLGLWHDVHLKIEGKGAQSLQMIFTNDWYFVTGKLLDGIKYFPLINKGYGQEQTTLQIVTSGPDSRWAAIMQAFFMAISRAKRHIYIASPYFLPTESIITAIKVASLGGIEVKIILPNRSDSKIVLWATRSYITELLEAGVRVYLYDIGFNHSKIITIDSQFSAIGSANMDIRSFEDNFEVTAFIYDEQKTKELENIFNQDLNSTRELSLSNWYNRSKRNKTKEAICRILSPLL